MRIHFIIFITLSCGILSKLKLFGVLSLKKKVQSIFWIFSWSFCNLPCRLTNSFYPFLGLLFFLKFVLFFLVQFYFCFIWKFNSCIDVCMLKICPKFIIFSFFCFVLKLGVIFKSWLHHGTLRKHLNSFCLFKIQKTILRPYFFLQLAHSGYTKLQKNTWNPDMNRLTLLEKWLKKLQPLWK